MDYLVSGATGFLGRKLVRSLLAAGNKVHYLARRPAEFESGPAFIPWQSGTEPALGGAAPFDAVIHLAGEPVAQRWTAEVRRRIADSRIEGTGRLVSALANLRQRPEVLVSASAIGYYGARGDEILTEQSTPSEDFLAKVCVGWEQEAAKARDLGIRVVHVRISVVLGPDGGALQSMLPLFRAGLGGRLASGEQWMSWICVNDMVRMLRFAAEHKAVSGAINASSPEPVRNAEFTQTLARVLRRPAVLPVPKFALKLALGELGAHVVASARVVPEAPLRYGFDFECPGLEGCLRRLL